MSTHEQTPSTPRAVTRRQALGRLLGLGAGAVAAVALPTSATIVEAATPSPNGDTVPTLPAWLDGQPDWLIANVERYARSLATLTDPLGIGTRPDHMPRAERVVWMSEAMVVGMNEPAAPRSEPAPAAPKGRIIRTERIATARIRTLDRNERRRLRRWLAKQPTGADQPIVQFRLGRYGEDRGSDFLDVATPSNETEPAYTLLDRVVREAGAAIKRPLAYVPTCCHRDPWGTAMIAAYPDGRVATYLDEVGRA